MNNRESLSPLEKDVLHVIDTSDNLIQPAEIQRRFRENDVDEFYVRQVPEIYAQLVAIGMIDITPPRS